MSKALKWFLKTYLGIEYDDKPGFDSPQTPRPGRTTKTSSGTTSEKSSDELLTVFDPEAMRVAVRDKYEEQQAKKQSDFEELVKSISTNIYAAMADKNYEVIDYKTVVIQYGLHNTYEGDSEVLNWKDQIREAVNKNLAEHGLKLTELSIYQSMFSDVDHLIREKYTVTFTSPK